MNVKMVLVSLLFNKMSSTIKTAIKVRPLLKSQIQQGYRNTKMNLNQARAQVIINDPSLQKTFRCDHLITPEASQDQTFSQCKLSQLVQKVLQGYNSTVFAYGQTGSGKSYTMYGGDEGELGGITGRMTKLLFKRLSQQKSTCKYTVTISFLQIYSEKVYDLFNSSSLNNRTLNMGQGLEGLRLRWNKDEQFTVQNLFIFECRDETQLLKYVSAGLKNRIIAAHKLNLQSSRSHSILSIKIEATEGNSVRHSRIDLVDLAGSERIGLTKTQGRLAKESIDINKSLFTLRQVINVLSENSSRKKDQKVYVPYRDSKLTSILKQSVGGNSYCLMIACLTPHDAYFEQNLSTLTYATKASFITNNPILNIDANTKAIGELRRQLAQVNSELDKANKHIELLSDLKNSSSKEQVPLEKTLKKNQQKVEMEMPSPMFGKRLSETLKVDYNSNISERLIESINMVRELLKSNKDLREKLEETECVLQQRNEDINELTRQNQALREGSTITHLPPTGQSLRRDFHGLREIGELRYEEKPLASQCQPRRQSLKIPAPITRPPSQEYKMYVQSTTSKPNNAQQKLMDIGKMYLNQKGADSAPTNFNKRGSSTSHNQRGVRGSSQQADRNAITAKFGKRNWFARDSDPKCFLSFYDGGGREDKNF